MNRIAAEINLNDVVTLAASWQTRANELITYDERVGQARLRKLIINPIDKAFVTKLIDQSFRSKDYARVADQLGYLLSNAGFPDFFSPLDAILMWLFISIGRRFPNISIPLVIRNIRRESSHTIISGEKRQLAAYLRQQWERGIRMNLNHLGEAVLGEEEALHRLNRYMEDLRNPRIEYISVKISSIYSQIHPLAFDHTVNVLKERLSELYRVAGAHYFTHLSGSQVPKFVNLDMEEYRDLSITAEVFKQTLSKLEFKNHSAGIALQAYLPDSLAIQRELTEWAKQRVASGGSPIKIRIVKGANMEMEQVDASLHNWALAPYNTKLDVDANYKRMIEYGLADENFKAVHLGVGSHNLFELAYAYQAAQLCQAMDYVSFEMLTGMAEHVRRALSEFTEDIILYAPVAEKDEFISAITYLIRRLDESTANENFLRFAYNLNPDSEEWRFLKDQFLASCERINTVGMVPHRQQNRLTKSSLQKSGTYHLGKFYNEPDTDWSLKVNRLWAEEIKKKWKRASGSQPIEIPLVINGNEIFESREIRDCFDPSQHNEKVCVARAAFGTKEDVDTAVRTAHEDPDGWRKTTPNERHYLLSKVARELRRSRGDLIGAAAAGTGKIFTESDVEVSEAIDFTEYYPFSLTTFIKIRNVTVSPKGVGVVISPWNFPLAIPCGGIVASLATGNTVILKPASEAVLPAWELCRCFWRAGVSKRVLQFLPCAGATVGSHLACHQDVSYVVLTGGTDTGISLLKQKPELQLFAETGGKNAIIVTAISDRDQAINHVIQSAFGNGGQKCSAASLLILEKEVFNDPSFKRQLIDATRSVRTGSAWDFENRMGPLIRPPIRHLKRALTQLELDESWALMPHNVHGNPQMWSPGIKWNVQPGSYTHMTEFFGPVLGVMKANNFDHALELVNQTGYGLTSGLECLDKRKQDRWLQEIKAGNLYINRGTTGAITLRQPFGGFGKSALGPGIKAGGPNYVSQFLDYKETGSPAEVSSLNDRRLLKLSQKWIRRIDRGEFEAYQTDIQKTVRAINSYQYHAQREFRAEKDYFQLRGEDNILRYLPIRTMIIRLHRDDSLFDILARIAAARIAGCQIKISLPHDIDNTITAFLHHKDGRELMKDTQILHQSDDQLMAQVPKVDRIRYAAPERVPSSILQVAAESGVYISRSRVVMEGRIELLHYYRNQTISHDYHRYGNLGERAFEQNLIFEQ